MKDYQKTRLFLYPRLERFAEDLGQYARAKAVASCLGREDTEACVQALIDCAHAQNCCRTLKALLDGVFGGLTEEERVMLDYKYFRRRRGSAPPLGFSRRTYYRRQQKLESALNAEFLRRGMDEGWFLRLCGGVPAMRQVYEHVCARKECEIVDKRSRRAIEYRARALCGRAAPALQGRKAERKGEPAAGVRGGSAQAGVRGGSAQAGFQGGSAQAFAVQN